MDYQENRQELLKNYVSIAKSLVLTKDLMEELFIVFPDTMESVKVLVDDTKLPEPNSVADALVKSLILLELTKKRYSCQRLIEVLDKCSAEESVRSLATFLKENNEPQPRKAYGDEINIEVDKEWSVEMAGNDGMIWQSGPSVAYEMSDNPRGMALIINKVKHVVSHEALRFAHIFKELLFDVQVIEDDLSSEELLKRMNELKEEINSRYLETKIVPQAMIVMVISHGTDDRILGKYACLPENHLDYDENDQIEFKEIMDVFGNKQSQSEPTFKFDDKNLLKMFFFTCCKDVDDIIRFPRLNVCIKRAESDTNQNTIQISSCAEGYRTHPECSRMYTVFGRALSESLAQFACKDDLMAILNRTAATIKNGTGYYAPEGTLEGLEKSVYFHPGHPK